MKPIHFHQARYLSNTVIGVSIRNILLISEVKASIILTPTLMGNCTFPGDMTHIQSQFMPSVAQPCRKSHGRVKMTYIGAYSRPIINIIRLYDNVIKDIRQSALYLNFKS